MKRLGNIYDRLWERELLSLAYYRSRKGKSHRKDIMAFDERCEEDLNRLGEEIRDGSFQFSGYSFFKIFDPKERVIAVAPLRDRIVHHALIAIVGERLERSLVDRSFACRKGKGQWAAVACARKLAIRHEWCLKIDIKSFFDSVDHEILKRLLARKIKDVRILRLIGQLIGSYQTEPGKGLPIGNLTSQYFANLYLDAFDRWIERTGGAEVRYMDDVLIFGERDMLKHLLREMPAFLEEKLRLRLKNTGGLHRCARGVDFLGTRVFPDKLRVSRRTKVRYRRNLRRVERAYNKGMISELACQRKLVQLSAFLRNCETSALRRRIILEVESGELSHDARRLLEQQQQRRLCSGLAERVSQQQLQQQHQPEQQQQLLGLPGLVLPRSSTNKGVRLNRSISSTAACRSQTFDCGAVLVGPRPNATYRCLILRGEQGDLTKGRER